MIVTVVAVFPSLRLVPASVSRDSATVKFSSDSTRSSETTVIEAHLSAPLGDPLAKVSVMDVKEKSPSPAAAMMVIKLSL